MDAFVKKLKNNQPRWFTKNRYRIYSKFDDINVVLIVKLLYLPKEISRSDMQDNHNLTIIGEKIKLVPYIHEYVPQYNGKLSY